MRRAREGVRGSTQREAMQRAKAEHANLVAAFAWRMAHARLGDSSAVEKGMQLSGYCWWYRHIVGPRRCSPLRRRSRPGRRC
jgi:hypothetical protein